MHGISLKCQCILFDMSASKNSPPFVPFCVPEQRLIATQLRPRTRLEQSKHWSRVILQEKQNARRFLAGSSFLQHMLRPCFMSVFKFTRVRVDHRNNRPRMRAW